MLYEYVKKEINDPSNNLDDGMVILPVNTNFFV